MGRHRHNVRSAVCTVLIIVWRFDPKHFLVPHAAEVGAQFLLVMSCPVEIRFHGEFRARADCSRQRRPVGDDAACIVALLGRACALKPQSNEELGVVQCALVPSNMLSVFQTFPRARRPTIVLPLIVLRNAASCQVPKTTQKPFAKELRLRHTCQRCQTSPKHGVGCVGMTLSRS